MTICVTLSPQVSLTNRLSHNTGRWTTSWNGSVTMWRAIRLMHTAWAWHSAPWMVTPSARWPRTRWWRCLAHSSVPTSTRACRSTRPNTVTHEQNLVISMNKRIKNQQNIHDIIHCKESSLAILLASLPMNSNTFCTNWIKKVKVNKQVNITSLISSFADLQNLPGSDLNEACQILDNLMDTYPLLSSIIIRPGRHFLHANIKHGWLTFLLAVPKRTHKTKLHW